MCPCVSADSGAARRDCPLCSGKGQTYAAAVQTRIGVTNQSAQKIMAQFGTYAAGDALLTLPADSAAYGAGRHDRFRALNSTDPFSIILTRGEDDRLLGTVQSFLRCYWLNTARTAEIEGALPVADSAGNLTWPSGLAPPTGRQYSLSGARFVEYYVFPELPADRNHHAGAALPRKVLGKVFDLFGR